MAQLNSYDTKFSGQYINHQALHSRREVEAFLEGTIYSNLNPYEKMIRQLCSYEDSQNRRRKVYAIELTLMIPTHLNVEEKHELVKRFMRGIHYDYKKILFVYKFITIGKGHYIKIMAFERECYLSGLEIKVKYQRDMYINSKTGRTTSKEDKDAIVRCKKGDFKRDKEGQIIKKKITVSPIKVRHLAYHNDLVVEKKLTKFINFIDKLKGKLITSLSDLINIFNYKILKSKQYEKKFSKSKRIKVLNYNQRINKVNLQLTKLQEIFRNAPEILTSYEEAYISFNRMFYSLAKILEKEEFAIQKGSKYKISLSLTKHHSFQKLNDNLDYFVQVANNRILKWYEQEFEDVYAAMGKCSNITLDEFIKLLEADVSAKQNIALFG